MFPLLLWALLEGSGRWQTQVRTLLIAAGLAGCIWTIFTVRSGRRPADERAYIDPVMWLKEHSSSADRVMSRYPTWVAAVAGNRGIRWSETNDSEVLWNDLSQNRIHWLIIDHIKVLKESAADRFAQAVNQQPARFKLAYETQSEPRARVYQVVPLDGP